MNALLGGKDNGQGQGGSGMNFGNLAGHLMGGSNSNDHGGNGNGNSGHTASGGGKHTLGKIGGALASSFLHTSGDKPGHAQNAQGVGQTSGNQHHGLAGSLMGGVANMFGNSQAHQVSSSRSHVLRHIFRRACFLFLSKLTCSFSRATTSDTLIRAVLARTPANLLQHRINHLG